MEKPTPEQQAEKFYTETELVNESNEAYTAGFYDGQKEGYNEGYNDGFAAGNDKP